MSRWARHLWAWRYLVPVLLLGWALAAAGGDQLGQSLLIAVPLGTALLLGPRWPLLALIAAFAGLFLAGAMSPPLPEDPYLAALVFSCFLFGRFASLTQQPWAAAVVLLLLSANLLQPDRDVVVADAVFPVLLTAGPWMLGLAVQLAKSRERDALTYADTVLATSSHEVRQATAEERLRIARELHDVLANDISTVSLLAQVSRRDLEEGRPVDTEALHTIEQLAQRALSDVRRVLGVLRVPEGPTPLAPAPGLDALADLVDAGRACGQDIRFVSTGEPRPTPLALGQAAYRIVQEALTNARRHGGPGPVDVREDWTPHTLAVTISNPLRAPVDVLPEPGHGLIGIRERVQLFGGDVRIGADDGRWIVAVELPTPAVVARGPA